MGAIGTTACVGSLVLVMAAILLAGLVWLYRLGWGSVENDEFDDFDDEFDADDFAENDE
jgi:hypothetical protein